MASMLGGHNTKEKDLGLTISADMKVSEQENTIFGLFRRNIVYKEKELIILL